MKTMKEMKNSATLIAMAKDELIANVINILIDIINSDNKNEQRLILKYFKVKHKEIKKLKKLIDSTVGNMTRDCEKDNGKIIIDIIGSQMSTLNAIYKVTCAYLSYLRDNEYDATVEQIKETAGFAYTLITSELNIDKHMTIEKNKKKEK